jgi:hypothetical protein
VFAAEAEAEAEVWHFITLAFLKWEMKVRQESRPDPSGLSGLAGLSVATVASAAGGAAAGFAAGGIMGGNLKSALSGAVAGGVGGGFGAAFGTADTFGQMLGGGVNGYLQTGTSQGLIRGFAAGALPNDLGFADIYNKNPFANIAIGITRDGARGALVEGNRRGFLKGVGLGQLTNAFGHLFGAVSSGFSQPEFRRGAFYYLDSQNFGAKLGFEAITFGNVITGNAQLYAGVLSTDYLKWLDQHERGHIGQFSWMGATYLPLQAISQWSGNHIFEYGPFHPTGYETAPR